jgi:hypothetical protein
MIRRAARVDANQAQVISALRAAGAYVYIISLPVDLLVGYKGKTYLVEIKDGPKKTLTRLQQDFFGNWCGGGLHRINNADEALNMIGLVK